MTGLIQTQTVGVEVFACSWLRSHPLGGLQGNILVKDCICVYMYIYSTCALTHPPSAWGRFEHRGSTEALARPI